MTTSRRIFSTFILLAAGASLAAAREITFEERVAAQTAIERVYWQHRIWPESNVAPKPALDDALPQSEIRAKVERYLKISSVLDARYSRPIDGDQLQAELDRMAAQTQRPSVLRELFEALGNDPTLVAECLARPALAERLFHSWDDGDVPVEQARLSLTPRMKPHDRYELPALLGPTCTDDTWAPTSGLIIPHDRQDHSAVWTGTEMIVWGGAAPTSQNVFDDGGRYNPATDTWVPTSSIGAPSARSGHVAVWTGTEMIVWGHGTNATPDSTGGRYDPLTDTWTSTSLIGAPAARTLARGVWTGTRMIVWGGRDASSTLQNTGGRYDPVTDTWTATTLAGAPTGRVDHTAIWTGTEMIVWGGSNTNTGGRYNPASDTWVSTTTTAAPAPRSNHAAVWTGSGTGGMIVFGPVNTGGIYFPSTDAWTPTSTTNAPSFVGLTAVWTGTQMIVFGTGGARRYTLLGDTWTNVSATDIPTGRWKHTAVWTGTEMIVWGGATRIASNELETSVSLGTGGRYSPSSDSWVPTAFEPIPTPRERNSAVWTGAEMIVWGGITELLTLQTGGRFDPATTTWTPTTLTGAPLPRQRHSALWTGSRMLVWGGAINQSTSANTGGSYDPATDTWTATSTTGAPTARTEHGAVWTGSKMIVWGGRHFISLGSSVQTGGVYDPGTDTWTATTTTGAPPRRYGPVAVWTGSKMIVWGGINENDAPKNTGGQYDPATDTWTSTSMVGVPQPRFLHVGVWTGSRMIVWGGAVGETNTGGQYDPIADTWTPTTLTGAPTARGAHAGVWTGVEMIVWGGCPSFLSPTVTDTGGRYNPTLDRWIPTTLDAAATKRRYVSSVWTGDEMIVWGGEPGTSTGGRYCACATPATVYRDVNGDGFGSNGSTATICDAQATPAGYAPMGGDCDDAASSVYPGAPQACDGVNNDCSAPGWPSVPANEANADGDGFRICAGDCDDGDPAVFPGAPEICDGQNNNCAAPGWPALPASEADADADTYRVCAGDCNDGNPAVNPGAIEVCNGIDDDCDSLIDEDALGQDTDADSVRNLCDNCPTVVNVSQVDSDADGRGNACDNCATVPNPNQADPDADARGTACDNCPGDFNPAQDDLDADRVGDVCDNCISDANGSQSDTDLDGEGDVCDLNDGIIWEYRDDKVSVSWQMEQGPVWNVYIGSLAVLKSSGVYTQVPGSNPLAARTCNVGSTTAADPSAPAIGQASFSLVTGVPGGVEGTLGADGNGVTRPNANPCP